MKLDFDDLRKKMVQGQLISRGIKNPRVLRAFAKVARHLFVPEKYQANAYDDSPLPIGSGQTISQPYMVALMTESLRLSGKESVLEVGTGSGYQTAILAELAGSVFSLERIVNLAQKAKQRLEHLGCNNVRIKSGDGTLGWPEQAPYDAIIVTAGAPNAPPILINQLKQSGRLVIPIGGSFHQTLTVVKKNKSALATEEICACVFVPLIGKHGWRPQNA